MTDGSEKITDAIKRLRQFEPAGGYYLAFSGGKDSVVLLELAKRAGVKYDAHYNLTTVDPPELVKFIRDEHPEVVIEHPPITMWDLIIKKGMPPTRLARYCCDYLKEGGGTGRRILLGVRWQESRARSRRMMVEKCLNRAQTVFVNPIIDFSESDIWDFIRAEGIPYCGLYDEGFKRLGCILCPMQGVKAKLRDAERWPKYKEKYIKTFDRMLAERIRRGRPARTWTTGQEVYDWWVAR